MAERPTACPEWQDHLTGWVVAQLDPAQEAQLVAHLAGCPVCRAEGESLLAVAAVALAADPDGPVDGTVEPPAHLRDRVVRAISAERRSRRLLRAGGVALAAVAASVVALLVLAGGDDPAPVQGEEVAFTVVPEGASAEAVVAAEDRGSVVQLVADGLDPDVTYALWLTPPGGGWDDRVAAGTFRPDADGHVDVRLRCALPAEEYGRAWATTPDGKIALDTT
jgi:anti-sigma factor RsiW